MNEVYASAGVPRPGRLRSVFLGTAVVLVLCITACQAYYYHERSLPAISGVVLDMRTGKPISGAQVGACYLGPMASLAAPARPVPIGGGGTGRTDAQGRFSFQASKLPVNSPLYFLFGPNEVKGIWLVVYSKDYVTCLSDSTGLNWKRDERLSSYKGVSLNREGSRWRGFRYTVRMAHPQTEEQWQEKTGLTLLAASSLPRDLADQWLFNDLSGYLERWPQGEKAGEYYSLLWETAAIRSCDFMREEVESGQLSRKDLMLYYDRGSKIVTLAMSFSNPPGGMDRAAFQEGLAEHEASIQCAKELLDRVGPARKEMAK